MSIEADKRVSEQVGIERVAEHVSYAKHETSLLEVMLAGLQERMLWAIDMEREAVTTQVECMNKIEEINVVLGSRRKPS